MHWGKILHKKRGLTNLLLFLFNSCRCRELAWRCVHIPSNRRIEDRSRLPYTCQPTEPAYTNSTKSFANPGFNNVFHSCGPPMILSTRKNLYLLWVNLYQWRNSNDETYLETAKDNLLQLIFDAIHSLPLFVFFKSRLPASQSSCRLDSASSEHA